MAKVSRFDWERALLDRGPRGTYDDETSGHMVRAVLLTLSTYYPFIRPSQATLARACDCGLRTVRRALDVAEREGWIVRARPARGSHKATEYLLNIPSPARVAGEAASPARVAGEASLTGQSGRCHRPLTTPSPATDDTLTGQSGPPTYKEQTKEQTKNNARARANPVDNFKTKTPKPEKPASEQRNGTPTQIADQLEQIAGLRSAWRSGDDPENPKPPPGDTATTDNSDEYLDAIAAMRGAETPH